MTCIIARNWPTIFAGDDISRLLEHRGLRMIDLVFSEEMARINFDLLNAVILRVPINRFNLVQILILKTLTVNLLTFMGIVSLSTLLSLMLFLKLPLSSLSPAMLLFILVNYNHLLPAEVNKRLLDLLYELNHASNVNRCCSNDFKPLGRIFDKLDKLNAENESISLKPKCMETQELVSNARLTMIKSGNDDVYFHNWKGYDQRTDLSKFKEISNNDAFSELLGKVLKEEKPKIQRRVDEETVSLLYDCDNGEPVVIPEPVVGGLNNGSKTLAAALSDPKFSVVYLKDRDVQKESRNAYKVIVLIKSLKLRRSLL